MSGGHVAYHLRTNKAVDRHVFVDVLMRVHGYRSLAKYAYIGFGGPFLEDFRLVHSQLGLSILHSIEQDSDVFNRQKFNRPLSNIKCELTSSGDFIARYQAKRNAVIWLDYAKANDQRGQLEEFSHLLPKLRLYDVVKLTLNASPHTLGFADKPVKERQLLRKDRLRTNIGDLLPNEFPVEAADERRGLANLLFSATLRAAHDALAGLSGTKFLPITAFRYSDSQHQMLTVTCVLIGRDNEKEFLRRTQLAKWDLFIGTSKEVMNIEVPSLSVRERLFVDARLPRSSGARIVKALGFNFGADEAESVDMVDSYARYYRHLPYFARIVP